MTDPRDVATCGTCGRSWDIAAYPTPASLCPFCNGDEAAAARHEVPTPPDMRPRTDHAAEYADTLTETMRTAVAALDTGQPLEDVDPETYLDEWPLEIVRQVGRRFEVVVTVGGPDARLTCG